jgi:hypothetical protein
MELKQIARIQVPDRHALLVVLLEQFHRSDIFHVHMVGQTLRSG